MYSNAKGQQRKKSWRAKLTPPRLDAAQRSTAQHSAAQHSTAQLSTGQHMAYKAASDLILVIKPDLALVEVAQVLWCALHVDQQACLQLQPGQPVHHPGAACHAQQAHHQQEEARTDQANYVLLRFAQPHLQKEAT